MGIALLLVARVAVADDFGDVPPGHPFHDEIGAISGAGITSGCGSGNYCPESLMDRGEVTVFMQHGLGRVASAPGGIKTLTAPDQDIVTLTITPGGVPGKTAFVKVTAAFTAFIESATGCPCNVSFRIDGGVSSTVTNHFATLTTSLAPSASFSGANMGFVSGAATEVFVIASGVQHTIKLKGALDGGTGTVKAYGSMTAIYAPFGASGANTLLDH